MTGFFSRVGGEFPKKTEIFRRTSRFTRSCVRLTFLHRNSGESRRKSRAKFASRAESREKQFFFETKEREREQPPLAIESATAAQLFGTFCTVTERRKRRGRRKKVVRSRRAHSLNGDGGSEYSTDTGMAQGDGESNVPSNKDSQRHCLTLTLTSENETANNNMIARDRRRQSLHACGGEETRERGRETRTDSRVEQHSREQETKDE